VPTLNAQTEPNVLCSFAHKRVPYVLTRGSHPEVVMIPYKDLFLWQELQEKEVLGRFDRLLTRMAEKNAAYGDEEVAADIERARRGQAD
jgi:PHD/YefM family antitoxin component YafN of YafNO toxin-antitoxin module